MFTRFPSARYSARTIITYLAIVLVAFGPAVTYGSLTLNFRFADTNSATRNVSSDAVGTNYTVNVWATISSASSLADGFQAMFWGAQTNTDTASLWTANIQAGSGAYPQTTYATISGGATTTPNSAVQSTLTNATGTYDLNKDGASQMATAPANRSLVGFFGADGKTDLAGSSISDPSGFMRSAMGTGNILYSNAVPAQTVLKTSSVDSGATHTFEVLIGTFNVVSDFKAGSLPGSSTTAFSIHPVTMTGVTPAALATWVEDYSGSGSPTVLTGQTGSLIMGSGITFTVQGGSGINEWQGASGASWDATGSWSLSTIPNGNTTATGTANFLTLANGGTVNLQATDRTVKVMAFKNTAGSYTIASASGGKLLFSADSGNASIQFDTGNTQNHTVTAGMQLVSNLDVNAAVGVTPYTLSLGSVSQASQINWNGKTMTATGGTLKFANTTATNITSGSTLTINSGVTVELAGTTSGTSSGSTYVNVANSGTLNVTGTNQAVGDITNGGTGSSVSVAASANVSATSIRADSLAVANGGTATIRASSPSSFPTPSGNNSGLSVLKALNVNSTGTLDLKNNDLMVDYTGVSVRPTIAAKIASAYNFGAWNQPGITSTTAASSSLYHSLGYMEASDYNTITGETTFDGLAFDATTVLVKYTWSGDANLTGIVDIDDYFQIDSGFANSLTGWMNGDFDHNGVVDIDDYFLIDTGFANGGALNSLPEPATLSMLAFAVAAYIVRARGWSRHKPRV